MKAVALKIRRLFLAGLLVTLPLAITILVFKFAFETLDNFLGPIVTHLLRQAGLPIAENHQAPGIGVVSTFLLVLLLGLFTTNFIGRKLLRLGEWLLAQIPIIRSVYIGAKQIIDTIALSGNQSFSKVVMVEYPRRGIYCLAFITGRTRGEAQARTGKDLINIFLPTTPNPTSGFFLLVPSEDLVEMDMTVEDGIKMIVSGGLVTPPFPRETGAIRATNGDSLPDHTPTGDKTG